MLERKGMIMNHEKLYRLDGEEGLAVKRRRGRRRARGSRAPMPVAGQCARVVGFPRRHVRGLTQVPHSGRDRRLQPREPVPCRGYQPLGCRSMSRQTEFSRLPNARIRSNATRPRGARELDALVRIHGKPAGIASDNGTEFTRCAILKWAGRNDVPWHDIDPGKPQQNVFIGSFNGSLRDA